MLRIEYTKDDILATTPDDECSLCKFKYIVATKCCNKKLCDWHVRNNGEHADQTYYSCELCETVDHIGDDGFVIVPHKVYCELHNILTFCNKCQQHYCDQHIIHDCLEPIIFDEPPLTLDCQNIKSDAYECDLLPNYNFIKLLTVNDLFI